MIAPGKMRPPIRLLMARARAQVISVKFIKTASAKAQLFASFYGGNPIGAKLSQDMADQRRGATMDQLEFFIGPRIQRLRRRERWIFRFALIPVWRWKGRTAPKNRPDTPSIRHSNGAQVASPQSPILR